MSGALGRERVDIGQCVASVQHPEIHVRGDRIEQETRRSHSVPHRDRRPSRSEQLKIGEIQEATGGIGKLSFKFPQAEVEAASF